MGHTQSSETVEKTSFVQRSNSTSSISLSEFGPRGPKCLDWSKKELEICEQYKVTLFVSNGHLLLIVRGNKVS